LRQVSIDSIFFDGKFRGKCKKRIVSFFGRIFPQDLPGITLSGMTMLPSRSKTFPLFETAKSTSIQVPGINRLKVFARFTIR